MSAMTSTSTPMFLWFVGDTPQQIFVQWFNGINPVYVYWGEDDKSDLVPANTYIYHTYPSMGAYLLRVHESGGEQALITQVQIVIRNGRPAVSITQDNDDPTALTAHFPDLDATGITPTFRIYWQWPGDPAVADDVLGVPGETFTRRNLAAGPDTVRVTDLTSKWWVEQDIDVPGRSIDFTMTAEKHATYVTVTLTVTKAMTGKGKNLVVDWGDTGILVPFRAPVVTYDYPDDVDATYLVQVFYADRSDVTTKPIAISGGSS